MLNCDNSEHKLKAGTEAHLKKPKQTNILNMIWPVVYTAVLKYLEYSFPEIFIL